MLKLSVLVGSTLSVTSASRFGVDLSVPTDESQWNCLLTTANTSFGIVRVYRSSGKLDDNAVTTIKSAHAAGLRDIHGYIFPCISESPYSVEHSIACESPSDQMKRTIDNLESNGVAVLRKNRVDVSTGDGPVVRRLWFDIEDEDPHKYYSSDLAVNQAAISEMARAAEDEGVYIGIYTTKTYWGNIMNNTEGYAQYPLWYPRYDGVNSMDFFQPFGGWTDVQIKQTAGDAALCLISQVDTDYMELTGDSHP